jgi:hypothetical protein
MSPGRAQLAISRKGEDRTVSLTLGALVMSIRSAEQPSLTRPFALQRRLLRSWIQRLWAAARPAQLTILCIAQVGRGGPRERTSTWRPTGERIHPRTVCRSAPRSYAAIVAVGECHRNHDDRRVSRFDLGLGPDVGIAPWRIVSFRLPLIEHALQTFDKGNSERSVISFRALDRKKPHERSQRFPVDWRFRIGRRCLRAQSVPPLYGRQSAAGLRWSCHQPPPQRHPYARIRSHPSRPRRVREHDDFFGWVSPPHSSRVAGLRLGRHAVVRCGHCLDGGHFGC